MNRQAIFLSETKGGSDGNKVWLFRNNVSGRDHVFHGEWCSKQQVIFHDLVSLYKLNLVTQSAQFVCKRRLWF